MTGKAELELGIHSQPQFYHLRLFGEGMVVGTVTGVVIALFRYLLDLSDELRPEMYAYLLDDHMVWAGLLFIVLLVIAFILARIAMLEPMTGGSGIPQIKGILQGSMRMRRSWRVLALKFISATLGMGAGMSLGRQGPSVHLGACVGQGLAELDKDPRVEKNYLLVAGSGAGLAAAFNAPLAGVIFAIEELHKHFSPQILYATVAASVTATAVVGVLLGQDTIFRLKGLPVMPIGSAFLLLIGLGLFEGLLARGFNFMLIWSLNAYDRTKMNIYCRFALPLLAAGVIGFFLPEIQGGGAPLVDSMLTQNFVWQFLLVLLFAKFFFTMLCFGSGAPGGIFLPMLTLGAIGGALYAKAAIALGLLDGRWLINFMMFGMAAYFSGVARTPITAAVLLMEMTGAFDHLMCLIIVSMSAYIMADITKGNPIYEELMERSLLLKKEIEKQVKRRRSVCEVLLSAGSPLVGQPLADVDLPGQALVVNINRSAEDVVPAPETILQAGDMLRVIINDNGIAELHQLSLDK